MKYAILLGMLLAPFAAFGEGRCPPGQYPVGDQAMQGCAPIPASGPAIPAPRPTGEWETRWGAIAQDAATGDVKVLAIGVSASRQSKREATEEAMDQCRGMGGAQCKILLAYKNQCVAMAGPEIGAEPVKNLVTQAAGAPTVAEAKANALRNCASSNPEKSCSIIYSACSMSEFRSFR